MNTLPLFPLRGAILFPELHLPLHVFEPRYREMIGDVIKGDKRIGIIQPQQSVQGGSTYRMEHEPLFTVGCAGRIVDIDELEDGDFNIVLEGESRFQLCEETNTSTPYRQARVRLIEEDGNAVLASVERAGFESEARRFADAQGYSIDWDSLSRLDDQALVNGVAQIAPFDAASKQALLEADTLSERCELLIQLMQFFGHHDNDDEHMRVTLQ